jgi:pimeloyl-ACP methyl ester carboxylesterase
MATTVSKIAVAAVLAGFALTGCGGSTPSTSAAPAAGPGVTVTFPSTDGVVLSGRGFGSGAKGVVLAHMYPADQSSWFAYAQQLAAKGYRVLTFDFRGYGASTGTKDIARIADDVEAAYREIKHQGATRVALVGASMGGTASLLAASRQPVVGVVTLSAPVEFMGLDARSVVKALTAPKLFMAAEKDVGAAGARELALLAAPPKGLFICPGGDHGTDLLQGDSSKAVADRITAFLSAAFTAP